MKRIQFSISDLMAATVVVALALSLPGAWWSPATPYPLWIASLLPAYWRSSAKGWRQIARTIGTVAVVWGIFMLCGSVYALSPKRRGGPEIGEVATHGFIVVLAAVAAALVAACAIEAVRAAARWWLRAGRSRRVASAFSLLALAALAGIAGTTMRPQYWQPRPAASADPVARVGLRAVPADLVRRDFDGQQVVSSPDGRFRAVILDGSQRMLVVDTATGQPAARFNAAKDDWFEDVTFYAKGNGLAALRLSRSARPEVVRWDAPHWTPRQPVPLDEWLDRCPPGGGVSYFLDRWLVIAYLCAAEAGGTRIEIFTADLAADELAPRAFASATVASGGLPFGLGPSRSGGYVWVADANGAWNTRQIDHLAWSVCGSGEWIARGSDLFAAHAPPAQLPGTQAGFLSDSGMLQVRQVSSTLYWRRDRHLPFAVPPFWDYLRLGTRSRTVLYDCRRSEVVARSRWQREG